MNDSVILRVNGREWGGWTSVRIAAGIDRIARDFSVQITRSWPGDEMQTGQTSRIRNGDKVEVLIGEDLVITGWVEATPVSYSASSLIMSISGRSKTADLIDCSATPAQYNNRSLLQIATELAKPFGITVVDEGAVSDALLSVQADQGETVMEVLNKMLGLQQVLMYDNLQGDLVIGVPGAAKATTALVLGENVLSADIQRSVKDRFSRYRVTGMRAGNDQDFADSTTTAIRGQASDSAITRYRPLMLRQSGNATTATCSRRSEFEMRQRAARTDETTYTVRGWRQGNGALWQPNMRVIVYDPVMGFNNQEMVIAEVSWQQDDKGTITELRVGPAAAYLPEAAADR